MNTNLIEGLSNLQPTDLDAGQLFSGKPSGTMVRGYAVASAYTPAIDHDYIFHESSRDVVVWFLNAQEPLYIFGPTGCGKTTCIKQLAARLNYPVFEVTGHGRLEFADLVGHLTVKNGNMTFEYGPLALAMRYGALLLLNEIDLTSPEIAAGLNSVLDGSPLCIAENGGELIVPHPMFRMVATANTNGGGDDTGLYQGTQRQNLAWLDRFCLCEVGYPAPDVEKALLERQFPVLPKEIRHKLVDYAGEVRKLFMGEADTGNLSGAIEVTLSTRTLLRWAELTVRFQPLAHQGIQPVTYALDRALGFRATRETRAMLHELAQRIFPQKEDGSASFTISAKQSEQVWEQQLQALSGIDLSKLTQPLPVIRLHKLGTNANGGKFWKAEIMLTGLRLTWGRFNTAGQSTVIEIDQCVGNHPVQECISRMQSKLRNGYSIDTTNTQIS